MINQPTHTDQINPNLNKATKLIPPLMVANVLVIGLLIFVAISVPAWQLNASIVVAIFLLGAMGYGYFVIRRGSVFLGLQIALYSVIVAVLLNGIWFEGLAFTFSIGLVMIVFQMTSLVLPTRQSAYAIGASLGVSLILIALENLDLPFRLFFEPLSSVLPVLVIILILVFVYQIYRNFSQFGIQGKLVISTILLSVFAVAAIGRGLSDLSRLILLPEAGQKISEQAVSSGLSIGELIFRQTDTLQAYSLNTEIVGRMNLRTFRLIDDKQDYIENLQQADAEWQTLSDDQQIVQDVIDDDLVRELKIFQEQFQEFKTIYIVDQLGEVVAATERPSQYYFGEESWWQNSIDNTNHEVYVELLADQDDLVGIGIAAPIYNFNSDQPIGVLFGLTSVDSIGNALTALRFGETGNVELNLPNEMELDFERDGTYELRQNETDEESLFEESINSDEPFFQTDLEGTNVVIAIAPVQTLANEPVIDGLGWQIVAFQESEEVFALLELQQSLTALIGFVVIVLSGVGALLFARRLAAPIVKLQETAVLFSEGDLSARADIEVEDEVGVLADTFNQMTERLQQTLSGLEARVAERTRVIEISARVSRNLSTILNPEQLVQEVVTQVRDAFDYYYAQIYLWDEFQTQLVMAGGTGEAGAEMLARGHALAQGKGLVGRAAELKLPVLIPNVEQEEGWLPNKLLPLTKAETAVPILIGNQVIGVLDVQHSVENGLGEQDVELIQSVANQFAIAYQNAQNYVEQQKQAEYEAQINEIRQKIQATSDVDNALQVAVRELGSALGARKSTVKLNIQSDEDHNGHT